MDAGVRQSGGFARYLVVEQKVLTGLAYFCGLLFLLYSIYVALEVIGRYFLGVFTGITDEIGGYVLALGGSIGLAYTLKVHGHVRIDVIFSFVSARTRVWLDAVAMLTMALFAFVVTDHLSDMMLQSYDMQATGHSLIQMPQWIIQMFVVIGYALLFLASLTSCIASVLSGLGRLKSESFTTSSH